MIITESQIRRAASNTNSERLKDFVKVFNEWNDKFGINTNKRVVHFLAQCWHESGALSAVEENLNYSALGLLRMWPNRFDKALAKQYAHNPEMIANKVYSNRMGNGDESSGDGWRFKGRGVIGITGKSCYNAYANSGFCVGDLMEHPEWLAKSPGAYKSAMWFWWKNGLNNLADNDDGIRNGAEIVKTITKRVNGGYNGLADRNYYYRKFKNVFGL